MLIALLIVYIVLISILLIYCFFPSLFLAFTKKHKKKNSFLSIDLLLYLE